MILKTLTLKNYRRFRNLKLDFDENVTVFIGKNGAGKTTVFEAVLYALFGTSMVRTEKEGVKADFVDPKQDCAVCLTFELEGKQYRVERSIKGKNSITDAFIFTPESGQNPIAERETGVNKFIRKLLGMDPTTFKISVFSAQKELNKFSSLRPEERKQEIRKLLNIDIIKQAITLLRADIRLNEAKIETLKNQQKDTKEIKAAVIRAKNSLEQQNKELRNLSSVSRQLQSNLKNQKQKVKILEKLSESANKLDKLIVGLESGLKETKENINQEAGVIAGLTEKRERLTRLLPVKEQYQKSKETKKLLEKKKEQYEKFKNLKGQLDEEEGNKKQLGQQLAGIKEQVKKLFPFEKELEITKEQLNKIQEKIRAQEFKSKKVEHEERSLNDKLKEINRKLANIKKLGRKSPCPTCTRPLKEHYDDLVREFTQDIEKIGKEIQSKQRENQKINQEIQTLKAQEQAIGQQIEKVEQKVRQLDAFKIKKGGFVDQLAKSEIKIKSLVNRIDQLGKIDFDSEQYLRFTKQFESLEKQNEEIIKLETEAKQLPKVKKRKRELLEKKQSLSTQLIETVRKRDSLSFDKHEFAQEKGTLDRIQEERGRTIKNLEKAKGSIKVTRLGLENNQENLREQKLLQNEIDDLLKQNRTLCGLEPLLQDFEKDLLTRIRPVLEQEASRLLRIITQGKYSNLELDQSYEIHLYDKGEKYRIKRFSGGEEDLINLCLRLAISRVLAEKSGGRKINFLILDEIFGSQDEDRQNNILQALQGLSTQFRQLFLITHVTSIKDQMPIVYEVSEINEDESRVKFLK